MDRSIDAHQARRGLFTGDVAAYDSGRPGYPERIYEFLVERCGLGPGTRVLEIGPGTGQATAHLLDHGATVTAVELGAEFADLLESRFAERLLTVEVGAFEDVEIAASSFDLVVAATSFHWVPTAMGLRRSAEVLAAGGWLALWWNVFGDASRPDPFHDALVPILERLAPALLDIPRAADLASGTPAYALDVAARTAEIDASEGFGPVEHKVVPWTGRHTPEQIRSMFASFSPWLALPVEQRAGVLDALEQLARDEFAGLVERPYLTSIYVTPKLSAVE